MLSPAEPGFWAHVQASPEAGDGQPDPIDRWSRRVITAIADEFDAGAVFPFDGPPWRPFFSWALRAGTSRASPVSLLVHETMGLFASWRGALVVGAALDLPGPGPTPCDDCAARPCLTACPAGALTAAGYDVPACHRHLGRPDGHDCLAGGCLVRRACPTSRMYGRVETQSAHHMRHFHK